MTGSGLPLEGVRVVEMTHMVMGPTCGMILAQLGAEVIKVEPPAGDKTRSLGGMGVSFFPLFNRGKRSVVLNLAKPEDRDTMHRLLAGADVLVEVPGEAEPLHIPAGFAEDQALFERALDALNPALGLEA